MTMASLLQETAMRAAREVLSEACEAILDLMDADDELVAEKVASVIVRVYAAGAKAGAVENAAQCVAEGWDVRPEFHFIDPEEPE
jgi:hypothetical protein